MNQPTEIIVERQIRRADGTLETAEVVSYYHRNPLRRLAARLLGVKGKVSVSCE